MDRHASQCLQFKAARMHCCKNVDGALPASACRRASRTGPLAVCGLKATPGRAFPVKNEVCMFARPRTVSEGGQ